MAVKRKKPKRVAQGPAETIFSLRGTQAWRDWFHGLAQHMGTPIAGTVDRALRELAERHDYEKPPARY